MVHRQDIETALDKGNLWAAMRNGRYWRLRRNGATKTWKRDADRFHIPVKAGLKSYGAITETDNVSAFDRNAPYLISETYPN